MVLKILCSGEQEVKVVPKKAESTVAPIAKQSPNLSGLVIVIYRQRLRRAATLIANGLRFLADGADSALLFKQKIKL